MTTPPVAGRELSARLSTALLPLAWLYGIVLWVYLLPYRLGWRKRHMLCCRVVSVGNLTFGGTGKSPMVRALCLALQARGLRPAVLSRGHGGALSPVGAVVSDGTHRQLEPVDCGDEPAALADALPGVPVVIGKDRRRAGALICERFRPDAIVLDDGMQYWQLHRDVEITLVDAERPFGNGRLLPAGTMREPPSALKRSDVVVVTGLESASTSGAAATMGRVCRVAPNALVVTAGRVVRAVVEHATGSDLPWEEANKLPVVAVSGIGQPASFESLLRETGLDVRTSLAFGDHCAYTRSHLDLIRKTMVRAGVDTIVTTSKDAVKLKVAARVLVLDIELRVDGMAAVADIAGGVRAGGDCQ